MSAGITLCWAVRLDSLLCCLVVCVSGVVLWGVLRAASPWGYAAKGASYRPVGVLGSRSGSPSLDRHLWAVQCGYVPGALIALGSPELVCMLEWLGSLYGNLKVVPAWVDVDASPGAVRLQLVVGGVLSGACARESLVRRYPHFGAVLHQILVADSLAPGRVSSIAVWSRGAGSDVVGESLESDGSPPLGA